MKDKEANRGERCKERKEDKLIRWKHGEHGNILIVIDGGSTTEGQRREKGSKQKEINNKMWIMNCLLCTGGSER